MTDEITLVIPVFNDEKHIEQCLTSALHQSLPACEVIVIDDGSTDRSGEIALEYQNRFPALKVIRHETNQGLVRAWQHGVSLAEG
ncbi:MAG: glycosyltransferase family 2 protein, partial [Firmicutes bacterium]|nr:glycosyltransferase family 2 protein [Bacillota bacterium]